MAEVEKKQNFLVRAGRRVSKFFREIRSELKKVVWPTRSQLINNTIIVIICVAVIGAFIWVFDWIAGLGVQGLISLVKS